MVKKSEPMNLVVAKSEAVLAFMLFKGWKLADTNEMYYILKPTGTEKTGKEQPRFHIPRNDQAEDFNFQINNVVSHLARLYNWDKTLLLLFLAVKPDDIDVLFQKWLKSSLEVNQKQASEDSTKIQISLSAA